MLYIIGLGLGDIGKMTLDGFNLVKNCSTVYFESYTSIQCYGLDHSKLEDFFGKKILEADRNFVEGEAGKMLEEARMNDVAFLVVGDPLYATTHTDLILRAHKMKVKIEVVNNVPISIAVGRCGLQFYNFGPPVSIVTWTDNDRPESFFDKIEANKKRGLHTLCLLDIKTKEQSIENLIKGRKVYEPPSFMTCSDAAKQLVAIIKRRNSEREECVISTCDLCVGFARMDWPDEKIFCSTLEEMCDYDLGKPLHSLVIPGQLHPLELEMLELFRQ